MFKVARPLT